MAQSQQMPGSGPSNYRELVDHLAAYSMSASVFDTRPVLKWFERQIDNLVRVAEKVGR
jgi:hypothetical protein